MASNDNLTTDAQHLPPRTKQQIGENVEENESEFKTESNVNHSSTKSKKDAKKDKNTPPAFAANVINISQSQGIHIGANYTIMMNNATTKGKPKTIVETEAIRSLFNNTSILKRRDLMFVSTHMDEGWRDVLRALNYSDGQISQFYENHSKDGVKEVIYQCLLDWTRIEPDDATLSKLSQVLWNNSQKDVVQRWSLEV